MAKFMYLYNGPATDMANMTEEQSRGFLKKWDLWMCKDGNALVDAGAPTAKGVAVVDDGSSKSALPVAGFSIVEAQDIEGAKRLAEGHPFLSDKTGKFSIEIFEILPSPV